MRRRSFLAGSLLAPLWACNRDPQPAGAEASGLRIASQTVLSDEVLWELGPRVREGVVAVSSMADDPRYSRVVERWPPSIPRVTGTSEALLALVPNLVIMASFTAAETRALVRDAGLRTLVLDRFDGFDDYRGNVRAIAEAVGAADEGERLVSTFDARLASLRIDDAEGLRVLSWNQGSVPAANTSFHDIATAAGFRNLPAEQGRRGHLQLGMEQLVAWDPDVLVVPCGEDDCEEAMRKHARTPGLRATKAARQGRIVAVPSRDLYSTGAGMLDVVERLVAARPGASP